MGEWPEHMPSLLRRIHAARGSLDHASALPRLAQLPSPDLLSGMTEAVRLLADAIAQDQRIVVVGDFDCDGATACAVGVRGLRMLGARHVTYAVPNRIAHGYGLSPALVDELAALQPDLLVTVDHGIACIAGVQAAKARGWRVLVTDHHLPGAALPAADAIVNPNLSGDGFPSKALAGVGVMFYVLLGLRAHLRDAGVFATAAEPDLGVLLDLVAVGTVADLVPLDVCNRALVAAGMRRLRAGKGGAGLRALMDVCRRQAATLCSADIAFGIAPRINAAGRLEDMAIGIECLLADDDGIARTHAELLHAINAERQGVQQTMLERAEAAVASFDAQTPVDACVPCLFDPDWHPGVVGLVASRLKEKLHRPVLAFAPAAPDQPDLLRGSARSIGGFHLRDALAAVDALHPGLIERFGGHAMAAGLSLRRDALAPFRDALHAYAQSRLTAELLQAELWSDGELGAEELCLEHACALRDGGPWGQGYPEPLFDGEFNVIAWRVVGGRHLKYELALQGQRVFAMHFDGWDGAEPEQRIRIAYRLQPDDWRGGDAIQLIVVHREAVTNHAHAMPCHAHGSASDAALR